MVNLLYIWGSSTHDRHHLTMPCRHISWLDMHKHGSPGDEHVDSSRKVIRIWNTVRAISIRRYGVRCIVVSKVRLCLPSTCILVIPLEFAHQGRRQSNLLLSLLRPDTTSGPCPWILSLSSPYSTVRRDRLTGLTELLRPFDIRWIETST